MDVFSRPVSTRRDIQPLDATQTEKGYATATQPYRQQKRYRNRDTTYPSSKHRYPLFLDLAYSLTPGGAIKSE